MTDHARLSHNVFFTLHDSSPEAAQAMVDECYSRLASIDGIASLDAGTRDPGLTREVNDTEYHVSLHVIFGDRAAHDTYQDAQAHLDFIEANKDKWKSVRVFDSTLRN